MLNHTTSCSRTDSIELKESQDVLENFRRCSLLLGILYCGAFVVRGKFLIQIANLVDTIVSEAQKKRFLERWSHERLGIKDELYLQFG
jgi:hypothetical protein